MKKRIKGISSLLCCIMLLTQLMICVTLPASAETASVTGATSAVSENVYIDGKDTGVMITQMKLSKGSKYALYSAGVVNVAEITDASSAAFRVINHGKYNFSSATVGQAAVDFNNRHNATVIAAVNACPWLMATTDYDGDHNTSTGPSNKGGSGGSMPMGFVLADGEIYNTGWLSDENQMDNKYYTDWKIQGQKCFVVTKDGTHVITNAPSTEIHNQNMTLRVKNDTKNKTVTADGINRLPAPDSMIIYNYRCFDQSLAYEDAREIYLRCDDAAFAFGKTVTGTVTAIYDSGDTATRPSIDKNTVVISARGASLSELTMDKYEAGDTISITCNSTSDSIQNAQQIIGGFFTQLENGVATGQPTNESQYPCSLVGIRADGSAILINVTTQSDSAYQGSRQMDLPALCKELGCTDAFMFDGGGSAVMVTLEEGVYLRRNGCSDGQPRVVGSSLAIVYEGASVSASYTRASKLQFIDGVKNNNVSQKSPVPEIDENGVLISRPYTDIALGASIDWINGVGPKGDNQTPYTTLASLYNATSGAGSFATLDGSTLTVGEHQQLTIKGWAQVYGGQNKYYWSVDQEHWYECVGGEYADATQPIIDLVTTLALGITSPAVTNSRFSDIAADLSAYDGQTINLTFAVTTPENQPVPILQINSLAIPHIHAYDDDRDPDCNGCEETREVETLPEDVTDAIVDELPTEAVTSSADTDGNDPVPQETQTVEAVTPPTTVTDSSPDTTHVNEAVTEAKTGDTANTSGCGSTLSFSALILTGIIGMGFITKRKEN